MAVTVIGSVPEVTMLVNNPLGAVQVADDAAPVSVPVTTIDSPAQTVCVKGVIETPLKLPTLIVRLLGLLYAHGLNARTIMS